MPVRQVMSRHPAQVAPGTTSAKPPSAWPVSSRSAGCRWWRGEVVGMVSLGDLAKCGRYEMEISRALTDISENIRRP